MLNFDRSLNSAVLRRLSSLTLAAFAFAAAPAHAVNFTESGDAGQTIGTAQSTGMSGVLQNIFGSLKSLNDADLFAINITNPLSFSAETFSVDDIDTQLFLFTASGAPVYSNDDKGGRSFQSELKAGDALRPVTAGLYYIGVSLSGYNPVNTANQFLFEDGLPTDTRGAAFGLSPALLAGFTDDGNPPFAPAGAYRIHFTGASVATVPAVPEPSSVLMLLAGGALIFGQYARRNRKSASAFNA